MVKSANQMIETYVQVPSFASKYKLSEILEYPTYLRLLVIYTVPEFAPTFFNILEIRELQSHSDLRWPFPLKSSHLFHNYSKAFDNIACQTFLSASVSIVMDNNFMEQ